MSVPTNEHYLPLLYVLGTMDARDEVRIIHEEIQNASVSMLCFMASGSRR
jgi:4,5-DOPA dioxygenase extradiol